jgi:hypothetical protein
VLDGLRVSSDDEKRTQCRGGRDITGPRVISMHLTINILVHITGYIQHRVCYGRFQAFSSDSGFQAIFRTQACVIRQLRWLVSRRLKWLSHVCMSDAVSPKASAATWTRVRFENEDRLMASSCCLRVSTPDVAFVFFFQFT